jgi:predicted oxidoreductase
MLQVEHHEVPSEAKWLIKQFETFQLNEPCLTELFVPRPDISIIFHFKSTPHLVNTTCTPLEPFFATSVVSNHNPMQIQLLKKYIKQDIVVNQLQFSIAVSNMVASGLEVNMSTDGAINRDGSVLDFCRLNDITIQAWSAFQMPNWEGCFIGSEKYPELNNQLTLLAKKYDTTETTIAASWILRHPAKMQAICGTTNESRLKEIISASEINLTREEWYSLYISAGHILP